MGPIQRWIRTASPLSKTLMGVSITTFAIIGYKLWYLPYVKRQRYRRAEEWANTILEEEEKEESERKNYNLSY